MFGGSKEDKEAKREEKRRAAIQKTLETYRLTSLTDPDDIASVADIVSDLYGTGGMQLGVTLGGGNDRDLQKIQMYYQRAIIEQNFIIIRQLDRLNKKLEK
ncbi:MAG: hypothetical protein PUE04_01805 [Lachnospira sp.]|nr:hypothetical protein [Lachnospira sp.]